MSVTTLRPATAGSPQRSTAPADWTARDTLVLAVALALTTGVIEAAFRLGIRFGRNMITWSPVYTAWLAPLSYLIFFICIALALWAYAAVRGGPRRAVVPVFILTFASTVSLSALMLDDRIHWIAFILLSLGVAVQAARGADANADRIRRLSRAAALVFMCVVATACAVTVGTRMVAERSALRALPAAPAGASNVLLIILDTQRAANTSLYGYARPTTPALERLAKTGLTFDRAITPATWTLPTHATVFTGRYVHELGVGWRRPLDDRYPTLAEVLAGRGYETAGFVANSFYTTRESGLARGFVHFEGVPVTFRELVLSSTPGQLLESLRRRQVIDERYSDRKTADDINGDLLAWLDARGDRPFFAFLNYFDAHLPYEPPEAFRRAFAADSDEPIDLYDASIAYLDDRVGRLLDALNERGLLDNTLVIVTADHGELLGEHGITGHTRSLYAPLLHVPLVIHLPGRVPAGQRVAAPVSLKDLPATVLDLIDVEAPEIPGRSLVTVAPVGAPVLSEETSGVARSIFVGDLHYVRRPRGEQLFDLLNDPQELVNLATEPGHAVTLQRLRSLLDSIAPPTGSREDRPATGGT